ncbi:MAG: Nif3-like dinuclear metal center hexameric protein [Firmicutes bacterium]|nr:Nif3-like dinuclear metal center hexameric protein [Bacillota bacterium]
MPTVGEAIKLIQAIAPEEHAYKQEYDNIGLIVGDKSQHTRKVMCCLDVTNTVIDEAIEARADLIISHHPIIFHPTATVSSDTVLGKKILRLIKHNIAVYSAHTNLDFVKDGINDFVAIQLGLKNLRTLEPYVSEDVGFGRIGELPSKATAATFREIISQLLGDKFVRIIGDPKGKVMRIAVINGGGGGDTKYIDMAIKAKADCLVTADVRHHVAVYALDAGITIIEPQHFNMEHCYIQRLVQLLKLEVKAKKMSLEVVQAIKETSFRS